eukprot:Protomagalhaensia_wolfi_Nauph_80__345@NODE_1192_length_1667_cov_18_343980_g915_i0_p4_GENE_NODE_1192_length_1667_cov_18_343980_g915_i0NODE_1192_length_1667_cov_18_343980_g915_i0_p4_ORF_typecomplete_len108_score7_12_NODE_1192_length_1667_cov_18_343980_g915_i013421665
MVPKIWFTLGQGTVRISKSSSLFSSERKVNNASCPIAFLVNCEVKAPSASVEMNGLSALVAIPKAFAPNDAALAPNVFNDGDESAETGRPLKTMNDIATNLINQCLK